MFVSDQLDEFRQAEELLALRETSRNLALELAKAKQRANALVEAVYQGAFDAAMVVGTKNDKRPPRNDKRTKKPEVALWHLTDWQGGKETASYNSQVMRERLLTFTDKAKEITESQRADHPVRDAVIMLGGDMVEGLFQFPQQPFEIDATIFDQFVNVSQLLVEVVGVALETYEKVQVIAEWGNHGRMGSKRTVVPRSDNIDRMTYELARRLVRNDRLTWEDSAEDIQRVQIGNYRALLMHGDEVGRAGYASPSQWQAAGNRWKGGAYKVAGAFWDFQDLYLGHYHRHASEPLSDGVGAIYWTGSTESDNRYARESMAANGEPSQRLHFVDPEEGRVTAQYQVWL